jgi:hypothetical protein
MAAVAARPITLKRTASNARLDLGGLSIQSPSKKPKTPYLECDQPRWPEAAALQPPKPPSTSPATFTDAIRELKTGLHEYDAQRNAMRDEFEQLRTKYDRWKAACLITLPTALAPLALSKEESEVDDC